MSGEYQDLIDRMTSLTTSELPAMKRKALKRVGKLVKDVMVFGCPVKAGTAGGVLKPGAMKASIKAFVHVASDKNAASDLDTVKVGPDEKIPGIAGIAVAVELGHANRPGSKTANTPPHPFVRPAADITRNTAPELFAETMGEEIARVMK